ncbi:MAG: hypothetical protein COA58_13750 [Bacteroidetes bacterium]|nr:MAG: hypothetical protein COA58_13750 [Bacteroidota bacterium]
MQKAKGYKRFYPWLKWIFSGVSIFVFVSKVLEIEGSLVQDIFDGVSKRPLLFFVILLLALVNWNAEAQKFKLLIRSEIKLSNFKAFLIVLGGMAISNFTPARTGEYIGRGLLLKKLHPVKVVIATVTGNIAQVLMTYGLGLICVLWLVFFTDYAEKLTELPKLWSVTALIVVMFLILVYAKRLIRWMKPRLPSKLAKTLNMVKKYNGQIFGRVAGIAFVRYLAFGLQFYLLLQLFSDFSLPVFALVLIPVAYLMQSVAPVPAISDVGVRVYVSQLLFGTFLIDSAILHAVTSLWFINLILPGFIGAIYLLGSSIKNR